MWCFPLEAGLCTEEFVVKFIESQGELLGEGFVREGKACQKLNFV